MMKTIIALVLASSASAFKPSKAFLGFGGLAAASKYDPKIFELEDASAALEQADLRRLQENYYDHDPSQQVGIYVHNPRGWETQDQPEVCDCSTDRRLQENYYDHDPSQQVGIYVHNPRGWETQEEEEEEQYYCDCCDDACSTCWSGGSHDGGVPVVDGVCQDFCSAYGYCGAADVYKAGGTDCRPCAASSSGNSRSRTGSLSIIIPVVIAAVLLLAAVLYLVRKRRVAAATPDETPQLDTEVQVEA